jgi:hypothetical protein
MDMVGLIKKSVKPTFTASEILFELKLKHSDPIGLITFL